MKNRITVIVLLISLLSVLLTPVVTFAEDDDKTGSPNNAERAGNTNYANIVGGGSASATCNGIFTADGLALTQEILGWFRVLAPAFLIVLSGMDFFTAVVGKYDPKEDALIKAKDKAIKRLIACVLLFFIPTIVSLLLDQYKGDLTIPADCITILSNLWR